MGYARRLYEDEDAQGMTEYIILVALIAIAGIAVVTIFGDKIKELFTASSDKLGDVGNDLKKK